INKFGAKIIINYKPFTPHLPPFTIFACTRLPQMKNRSLLFVVSLLWLHSCSELLENHMNRAEQENYASTYRGLYKGNYTGHESGTLKIEVLKSGYISLTRISANGTET